MASTTRLETVTSTDGTPIAYERTGNGPSLVLVHGSAGDRTRWELFDVRPAFAEHHTVYAVDRRGRGESGDTDEYAVEREFEDVAAVVDSIDDPVNLLGHSHGAFCSLEAARRTDNLRSLVLYEPPIPWEIAGPHLYNEKAVVEMETLLDDGENERALVVFLRDIVELPSEQLDALRSAPNWPARVDAAHTLPREERAPVDYEFDPARLGEMTTPTLLLTGSESPQWAREATDALDDALPNSRVVVMDGQGHLAMNTAPERFIEVVLGFIGESSH